MSTMPNRDLRAHLEDLCRTYDERYLDTDPLSVVHHYEYPAEQELVGFLASAFAFGQVGKIIETVHSLLAAMGKRPLDYVTRMQPSEAQARFAGFRYRFISAEDLVSLLVYLKLVYNRWGSLEACFMEGYDESDSDIKTALERFVARVLTLERLPFDSGSRRLLTQSRARYFFASPAAGSACKRLNLFLRWMVRSEGVDLGLWKGIPAGKLIIPLDTHIAGIARLLGLLERRTNGWAAAEEVTGNLREFDPDDPVKYDFALTRLGVLRLCLKRPERDRCITCAVRAFCRHSSEVESGKR